MTLEEAIAKARKLSIGITKEWVFENDMVVDIPTVTEEKYRLLLDIAEAAMGMYQYPENEPGFYAPEKLLKALEAFRRSME